LTGCSVSSAINGQTYRQPPANVLGLFMM